MARLGKRHLLGFQDWVYCVVDFGCLCGGANLAELTRVPPVVPGSYCQSACRNSLAAVGHGLQ